MSTLTNPTPLNVAPPAKVAPTPADVPPPVPAAEAAKQPPPVMVPGHTPGKPAHATPQNSTPTPLGVGHTTK